MRWKSSDSGALQQAGRDTLVIFGRWRTLRNGSAIESLVCGRTPLSMLQNVYSMRLKPIALKKWEPPKPHQYRSFFEWRYERDRIRAPEIDEEKREK
jgi:hypothetical protein